MGIHGGRDFARGQLPFCLHEHPSGIVRNRLCLVAGTCALMLLQGLDAVAQPIGTYPEWDGTARQRRFRDWDGTAFKQGEGVWWMMTMLRDWTTHDSILVESYIYNGGPDAKTLLLKDGALPRIALYGPTNAIGDGTLRSLTLADISEVRYQKHAGKSEIFHSFRMDLRAIFGQLPAGKYQVRLEWPKNEYDFGGLQRPFPISLSSQACLFRVRELTIEEITQKMPPSSAEATMLVPKQKTIEEIPKEPLVLSFTNRFEYPVLVHKEVRWVRDGLPVSEASLFVRKWFIGKEGGTWDRVSAALPLVKDSEPSESVTVPPGQSIELIVPCRWLAKGDGIYFYELRLFVPVDDQVSPGMIYLGSPKVRQKNVYSEPFLVKMVRDK